MPTWCNEYRTVVKRIMVKNTIIVCGLTEWEQETVRKHKGKCQWCIYYEGWTDNDGNHFYCEKDGKKKLNFLKIKCEDWVLDTR